MSGWAVASLLGGVLAAGIVALLVIISRAVTRTAANAKELIAALEQVQANTLVLADLEAQMLQAERVTSEATSALHQLRQHQPHEDGHDPERH